MKLSIRELAVMMLVALATMVVLWGGQRLYRSSAVQSPLVRSIDGVQGVVSSSLTSQGVLNVRIGPGAIFEQTYQNIQRRAEDSLGRAPDVNVESLPDPALEADANEVRLMVAQGEATGQYLTMNQQVRHLAQQDHISEQLSLGNYNVFVTLQSGKHYLDEVIPLTIGGGENHG